MPFTTSPTAITVNIYSLYKKFSSNLKKLLSATLTFDSKEEKKGAENINHFDLFLKATGQCRRNLDMSNNGRKTEKRLVRLRWV